MDEDGVSVDGWGYYEVRISFMPADIYFIFMTSISHHQQIDHRWRIWGWAQLARNIRRAYSHNKYTHW